MQFALHFVNTLISSSTFDSASFKLDISSLEVVKAADGDIAVRYVSVEALRKEFGVHRCQF